MSYFYIPEHSQSMNKEYIIVSITGMYANVPSHFISHKTERTDCWTEKVSVSVRASNTRVLGIKHKSVKASNTRVLGYLTQEC